LIFSWANTEEVYGNHETLITFTVSDRYAVDTALSYLQANDIRNITVVAPPDPFVGGAVKTVMEQAPCIF